MIKKNLNKKLTPKCPKIIISNKLSKVIFVIKILYGDVLSSMIKTKSLCMITMKENMFISHLPRMLCILKNPLHFGKELKSSDEEANFIMFMVYELYLCKVNQYKF